jgi:hypothetical protein
LSENNINLDKKNIELAEANIIVAIRAFLARDGLVPLGAGK